MTALPKSPEEPLGLERRIGPEEPLGLERRIGPEEPLGWAPVPGSLGLERRIGLEAQHTGTLTPPRASGSAGGGGGGGGRDGDDEGDGSPRARLMVRPSPLRASHLSRVHEDWTAEATAEAEDEELLEDVTHRQQTDPPNTTPNTGVPGAPAAGAAGDALNTARMAPALRTVPIAGIEAERDWLRSLPVLPSLPSQPTLAEARRVKTERPLPPVERASEEDPSVLRF